VAAHHRCLLLLLVESCKVNSLQKKKNIFVQEHIFQLTISALPRIKNKNIGVVVLQDKFVLGGGGPEGIALAQTHLSVASDLISHFNS
jgi:hypothetical protein